MNTVLTDSPKEAAAFINAGGIAAFPTETVYGLGANVFDRNAIDRIFKAKGRPADNPLIVHVSNESQIGQLVTRLTGPALSLIDSFFPGPLTIVLEKSPDVPDSVTAGLNTVAIRMPDHRIAQQLIEAAGPLVAPSANLSGKPSPTTWKAVLEDLDGRIDCVLKGEMTRFGIESTVVDFTGSNPLVLRSGAITLEQLREVFPETRVLDPGEPGPAKSPGLKHRHYSPKAEVRLVNHTEESMDFSNTAYIGLKKPMADHGRVLINESVQDYARSLYEFFRACDRDGMTVIYCEPVEETGIGVALMDRIRRAAHP